MGHGLLWSRSDVVAPKDIISIGFPASIAVLAGYILIGYPLAKMLCTAMGF